MNTKQLYKEIDTAHQKRLEENGLCYNLRKVKNWDVWRVRIFKSKDIDEAVMPLSYIEGEINYYLVDIMGQFGNILEIAIKEAGK